MGALHIFKPTDMERDALLEILKSNQNLPEKVVRYISEAAGEEPVYFFKGASEFTTQEAADILNVSRPFLIGLLDEGKILFRKTGKHRRINAASLMKFKQVQDEENQKIADELTQIAEGNF